MSIRRNDPDLFGETAGFDSAPDRESNEITLTLVLHDDTSPKSVKVSETGDDSKTILLPKSKISISATGRHTSQIGYPKYPICEITMPEWLAKDRGLI